MTKKEAKELFGSTAALCKALGLKPHTFYRWGDELSQNQADRVAGAYMRLSEERDKDLIHAIKPVRVR